MSAADAEGVLEAAKEEGEAKGLEKGREEGLKEASKRTALKMLAKGFDDSSIREVADLSQKELDQLKRSAKAHKA